MYIIDYDKLFENFLETPTSWRTTQTNTTYNNSKLTVEVKEDIAELALSVLGHDKDDIEIHSYEDRIEIKAKKDKDDKSVVGQLTAEINESIKVGPDFDGTKAEAIIKNGILHITLPKKDESKPKKLPIKVG
jgi:HSP20 family protein